MQIDCEIQLAKEVKVILAQCLLLASCYILTYHLFHSPRNYPKPFLSRCTIHSWKNSTTCSCGTMSSFVRFICLCSYILGSYLLESRLTVSTNAFNSHVNCHPWELDRAVHDNFPDRQELICLSPVQVYHLLAWSHEQTEWEASIRSASTAESISHFHDTASQCNGMQNDDSAVAWMRSQCREVAERLGREELYREGQAACMFFDKDVLRHRIMIFPC